MRFRGLLLIGALLSVQPLMAQNLKLIGPHYNQGLRLAQLRFYLQ